MFVIAISLDVNERGRKEKEKGTLPNRNVLLTLATWFSGLHSDCSFDMLGEVKAATPASHHNVAGTLCSQP